MILASWGPLVRLSGRLRSLLGRSLEPLGPSGALLGRKREEPEKQSIQQNPRDNPKTAIRPQLRGLRPPLHSP
eukprot:5115838-Pyramimonas_sp.AAC.1